MLDFLIRICVLIFTICVTTLTIGIIKLVRGEDMTEYFTNPIGQVFHMVVDIWNAC